METSRSISIKYFQTIGFFSSKKKLFWSMRAYMVDKITATFMAGQIGMRRKIGIFTGGHINWQHLEG